MIRLSSLILCASFLACALSQSPTATPTAAMSSTGIPGPSPTGTPKPPPKNEYIYKSDKGVCLRMTADVLVAFDYEDAGKVVKYNYTLVNASAHVDNSLSTCGDPTNFVLAFTPPERTESDGGSNYLKFKFVKAKDNAWMAETVQFNFSVTAAEFNGSGLTGKNMTYTSDANFFGDNVDQKNSYLCKSLEDVAFNSSTSDEMINVTLKVTNLQVQPYFGFTGDKNDKFTGTVTECAADSSSKGNKIVPIAVGAALAGLVIVVLIAYLIGRLKSRRQSSYEALS